MDKGNATAGTVTLLVGFLLAGTALTLASTAGAAERQWSVAGSGLKVDTPCARSVSIQPDPTLHGTIAVSAKADNPEEVGQLVVGAGAVIQHAGDECWEPSDGWGGHHHHHSSVADRDDGPTLDISVRVPMGTALMVREGGSSDYDIGEVGGPLSLDLAGSGDVKAAGGRDLDVRLMGSGNVDVGRVAGRLAVEIDGSGDLKIASADLAGPTTMTIRGSGDVGIDDGRMGAVTLRTSGSGDTTLPALAGLQFEGHGSGGVTTGAIGGPVTVRSYGSGDVSLASVTAASADIAVDGSAGLRIGGGRVARLTVVANGSGDIDIGAGAGDALLSTGGSGDIRVAAVSGRLEERQNDSGEIHVDRSGDH